MIKKIIFIDEDNTGLGPFAAADFRKKELEDGMNILADSKGTVVLFPEPANRKISDAAIKFGIALSDHQAEGLREEDFGTDVLMLALDSTSKKRVFDIHPGFSNIFTLKEYLGENGDIWVPIGETQEKYETACETVDRLVGQLIKEIQDEENENK